ncbi:MAG: hypothetical protein JSV52_12620 [Candidatus Zixiibacteriota bacterium]|nr:MAG: hypothetical protein JSV52_12620 [candidate division Zixibacteria bacterium]
MNKLLIIILVISIIGNFIGLFVLYKYFGAKRSIGYVRDELQRTNNRVEDLTEVLDRMYPRRMVFLHHSVGRGMLYEGGLRDSLLEMGVLVKGATYGDEIGQKTDICDWLPKFQRDMDRILTFKAHPDRYYSDNTSNDIVMFKSCFPNSDIGGDGQAPGNPLSTERTMANYRATFEKLGEEMRRYPERLYIYVTAPPLVPESTTDENAARALDFNRWLIDEYLPRYERESGLANLVVFDLFSVLADENGKLKESFRRSTHGDSHPNIDGSKAAAAAFMQFFRPVWDRWQTKVHV